MNGYGRVKIEAGKHGLGDYRVSISGIAPTLAELIYMVGWMLKAEDRYNRPGQLGGALLEVHLLSAMAKPRSPEQILKAAKDAADFVRSS